MELIVLILLGGGLFSVCFCIYRQFRRRFGCGAEYTEPQEEQEKIDVGADELPQNEQPKA